MAGLLSVPSFTPPVLGSIIFMVTSFIQLLRCTEAEILVGACTNYKGA